MKITRIPVVEGHPQMEQQPILRASFGQGCDLREQGCPCSGGYWITVSDGKTILAVTISEDEAAHLQQTGKLDIIGGTVVDEPPPDMPALKPAAVQHAARRFLLTIVLPYVSALSRDDEVADWVSETLRFYEHEALDHLTILDWRYLSDRTGTFPVCRRIGGSAATRGHPVVELEVLAQHDMQSVCSDLTSNDPPYDDVVNAIPAQSAHATYVGTYTWTGIYVKGQGFRTDED